jgi:hypothetical protein
MVIILLDWVCGSDSRIRICFRQRRSNVVVDRMENRVAGRLPCKKTKILFHV